MLETQGSTAEISPICAVVAACGGCPFYAVDASEEHARKLAGVEARLAPVFGGSPRVAWVRTPSRTGYRNRIRLRVEESGVVAFFNEHKALGCAALEADLRARVERVRTVAARFPSAFAPVAHLEVRKPDRYGRASVFLVARGDAVTAYGARDALAGEFVVAVAGGEGPGARAQDYDIVDDVFARVPLGGFMQINSAVNALLVGEVVRRVRALGASTVVDLFAGSGNFSLPLSASGVRAVAVELDELAVAAMRDAAREQGLALEAVAADATAQVAAWAGEGRMFDVVLVDAPRAGLKRGHAAVAGLARRAVGLCSCNVRTFANDSARIIEAGFRPVSVSAFDMFPGTEHVELFGWFER